MVLRDSDCDCGINWLQDSLVQPKLEVFDGLEDNIIPLSSPLGTSYYQIEVGNFFEDFEKFLSKYPDFSLLYSKLVNCGHGTVFLQDKVTRDSLDIVIHCDNRVCQRPACKKHRQYKFRKEHSGQVCQMMKSIRRPKAWIFTSPRLSYPIDRKYISDERKRVRELLDIRKHDNYGSVTDFSIHTEVKPGESSWYLHHHVVSGGIKNLGVVRELYGFQIKYEYAISKSGIEAYMSKYASKVPEFHLLGVDYLTRLYIVMEYFSAVYKAEMHSYGVKWYRSVRGKSNWVFVSSSSPEYVMPVDDDIMRQLACYYALPFFDV